MNSDNDGDCIITDCKESDCIIVTNKPLHRYLKLQMDIELPTALQYILKKVLTNC